MPWRWLQLYRSGGAFVILENQLDLSPKRGERKLESLHPDPGFLQSELLNSLQKSV
jgi:hypothetical protein